MKRSFIGKSILTILLITAAFGAASAQDGPPPDGRKPGVDGAPEPGRLNLLRELGLSREQMQQIRRMNQERRPQMEEATRRLREANRGLDQAIYADAVNDADFQARLKEFQLAQGEVARLRFISELNVRMILTPEQLIRFRELRERFASMRQAMNRRRQGATGQAPFGRSNAPPVPTKPN